MMLALKVALMFLLVVAAIYGVFCGASHTNLSHSEAQIGVALYGFASALTWGLSVVGCLIWSGLGVFRHPLWNGWFNFAAAICAAAAVGFGTI